MDLVNQLRLISIEFQKMKVDRLKSLEGNLELKKEFIYKTRPVQNRLDLLLGFK